MYQSGRIICRLAYVGGSSLRNKNKNEYFANNTLGLLQQQQHLCTGVTRQPAGQWRRDVTGPQERIKLALCVFVNLSYCWLVRHFAHLPMTCRTRGPQTSILNMKYSGEHNKRQCPDHRQTFTAKRQRLQPRRAMPPDVNCFITRPKCHQRTSFLLQTTVS